MNKKSSNISLQWLTCQHYHYNDLEKCSLHEEDLQILTTSGLPVIDSGYARFLPYPKIESVSIEGTTYLKLAPFIQVESGSNENWFLLNPATREVLLYSKALYDVGYHKSLFGKVNSNLDLFIYFTLYFINIEKNVYDNKYTFEEMKAQLIEMLHLFKKYDWERLAIYEDDITSYWRNRIFSIQGDIEEIYDTFIPFDWDSV